MAPIWKKLEPIGVEHFPYCLDEDDICYYARDYTAGGGYTASQANQLIANLKKNPARKGKAEWKYKEQAIAQFARELSTISGLENFVLTCVPPSTDKDDPLYDSRMEDVLRVLHKLRDIAIEFPFSMRQSVLASHKGGSRSVEVLYSALEWKGLKSDNSNIIIVDDVITSGAHFKACARMIRDHIVDANVIGLFWARSVWP